MYQRLDMAISTASNPEHEGHENPDHLIGEKKEDAREARHDEHHDGGDHGLAPGRPGDLLGLGADLLQELERTDPCHGDPVPRTCARTARNAGSARKSRRIYTLNFRKSPSPGLKASSSLAGVEGLEPPTPGFGERCSC